MTSDQWEVEQSYLDLWSRYPSSHSRDYILTMCPWMTIPKPKQVNQLAPPLVKRVVPSPEYTKSVKQLRLENEEYKSQRLCCICKDTQIQVISLPCGHLCACLECHLQLTKCPICRAKIKASARVHLT